MVRWRHNVPALERERLARRGPDGGRPAGRGLAQPAAALATAPVDGVAAAPDPGAVADRRCGRLERLEDREGRPADVEAPLGRFGLHAGVPAGPARSAAARRRRGESSRPARTRAPQPGLSHGVPVDDNLGRSGGGARPRSSGPCSQSARDASASCLRWRRRDSRVTAARSGEVRGAQWSEMDTKTDVWTVPAAPMKTLYAHRVPLCGRSIEILDAARTLGTVRWCSPAAGEGSSTHPRPWPMASGRRSGTGRPRRRTIRARSARRRSPMSSATRSRRRTHGRTCSSSAAPHGPIGKPTLPASARPGRGPTPAAPPQAHSGVWPVEC